MSQRRPEPPWPRHALALAGLVALQAVCAAFFLADVLGDLGWPGRWSGIDAHTGLEAAVALALIAGVVFGAREVRRLVDRHERAAQALAAASGAFHELLEARFEAWGLTAAERDVALLTVKGLSPGEIAGLRGSAQGTVRAQCARIYAKAGVSGRAELLGLFVEELAAGLPRAP